MGPKKALRKLRDVWQRPYMQKFDELNQRTDKLEHALLQAAEANERLARDLEANKEDITQTIHKVYDVVASSRDNIPDLTRKLAEARETKLYADAFETKNPKVTIRIATYNKAKELTEICLPSVLGQTYKNIEVIVVGDECTDDTAERIAALKDNRVTFINLKNRSLYPEDKHKRWYVAGSPGMNIGANKATGLWIAPLDDDDQFTPDHIEKLVKLAQKTKHELAYGALVQKKADTGEEHRIYSNPPTVNNFSFQGAIYPKALGFFQYDQQSWVVNEPGDWNLCRRMLLSGVTFASTPDVVGYLNVVAIANKKHYGDQ